MSDELTPQGRRLREVLSDLNITQVELARQARYTPKHISHAMRGKTRMSAEFAVRVQAALDVSGLARELLILQTQHELTEKGNP
jgi:plasmid maintenance system antidote protein VapI